MAEDDRNPEINMSVLIKTNPVDLAFIPVRVTEKPFSGVSAKAGEAAYLWFSETAGGVGLAARAQIKLANFSDVWAFELIDIEIPHASLSISQLVRHRDDPSTEPLATLAKLLYRYSHNKVVSISEDEATYLDTFFVN